MATGPIDNPRDTSDIPVPVSEGTTDIYMDGKIFQGSGLPDSPLDVKDSFIDEKVEEMMVVAREYYTLEFSDVDSPAETAVRNLPPSIGGTNNSFLRLSRVIPFDSQYLATTYPGGQAVLTAGTQSVATIGIYEFNVSTENADILLYVFLNHSDAQDFILNMQPHDHTTGDYRGKAIIVRSKHNGTDSTWQSTMPIISHGYDPKFIPDNFDVDSRMYSYWFVLRNIGNVQVSNNDLTLSFVPISTHILPPATQNS